ncbi:MAG: HNH endonuclease [Armatimonadetes bacterium]|nr:HNH endonuclease [Armatimonadota bacterium]
MSVTYIPADLRRFVIARADNKCEYCRLAEATVFYGCEIDHIISEKHGGTTIAANLAYACFACNRNKGSDVATLDPTTGAFVGFFNPRADAWGTHFAFSPVDGVTFEPRTAIGEATIRIFAINDADRVFERQILHGSGRYP